MTRARFLKTLAAVVLTPLAAPALVAKGQEDRRESQEDFPNLDKPLAEWRKLLSGKAFTVLFEEGTEPPRSQSPESGEAEGHLHLCGLLPAVVRFGHQVREWYGMAQFYRTDRTSGGHEAGLETHISTYGVPLHSLRWTPGPPVQGWSRTHRSAVV